MPRNYVLLLGVAGLSLGLAMYFDSKVPPDTPLDTLEEPESRPCEKNGGGTDDSESEVDSGPPSEDAVKRAKKAYLEKQQRKKDALMKKAVERAKATAYEGDGSPTSKRLFLQQQAYRRSREMTPVVPVERVIVDEAEGTAGQARSQVSNKVVSVSPEDLDENDEIRSVLSRLRGLERS